MPAEELMFGSTPGFGSYKRFLEHSIAHPAKMNTKLLKFLIKNFTEEGDVVLDPMCGSGSTGVVAALHGRNAVQVDIEKKFVDWAEEAKRKVETQATLTAKGSIRNICGDSRKLSELLKEADAIVTSPPYAESLQGSGAEAVRKRIKEGKYKGLRPDVWMSPTNIAGHSFGDGYSKNKENIGNLPHGKVDAIVKDKYGKMDTNNHGNENLSLVRKATSKEAGERFLPSETGLQKSILSRETVSFQETKVLQPIMQSELPQQEIQERSHSVVQRKNKGYGYATSKGWRENKFDEKETFQGRKISEQLDRKVEDGKTVGSIEKPINQTSGQKPSKLEGRLEEIHGVGLGTTEEESF